ncbi:MAG: CPBP family intramembrane metalloprotease [Clostridiales bacterium]|nr:CPBP family intramembrane metalloprotease [Clostridiales bacterium]
MKFTLPEPQFIADARKQSKGRKLIIELLIFLLVFLICSAISGAISTPFILLSPAFRDYVSAITAAASSGALYLETVFEQAAVFTNSLSALMVFVSLFATAATIGGVLIYTRYIEKRSPPTLGLRRANAKPLSEYLLGLGIGTAMLLASALISAAFGTVRAFTLADTIRPLPLLLLFVGFLIQGASEELLCRGYLMTSIARRSKPIVAIIVSAIVFGLLHIANAGLTWLAMLNLILFGAFAAVYFIKRGSIWGIAAIHSAWNFVQGNVIGVEVSGSGMADSIFRLSFHPGRDLITGGSFGLEGGLGVSVVLILGILITLLTKAREATEPELLPSQEAQAVPQ